jgi:hypothetical protein
MTYSAKATWQATGDHTLNQRTGPTFVANDGRTTATGAQITVLSDANFGQIFRVTRANFNSGHDTTQHYTNFFVQDSWRLGGRLTINPGIRYEQETLSGDIVKAFSLKNNWAPRIGATYDVTGDGRTKLFANYGRYFARMPNDLAARSLSADDGISRADFFDAGLTQLRVPVRIERWRRSQRLVGCTADPIRCESELHDRRRDSGSRARRRFPDDRRFQDAHACCQSCRCSGVVSRAAQQRRPSDVARRRVQPLRCEDDVDVRPVDATDGPDAES